MSSSPLSIARPWTPPEESEAESSPRSDYFSDPYRSLISIDDLDNHWPLSPEYLGASSTLSANPETPPTLPRSRPKPISSVTEPQTPSKSYVHLDRNNGAPRYPYTPDSARTNRTYSVPAVPPLAPMPWDAQQHSPTSPVQLALSSCMSHLENLIQTQQPNDDQMEYIIGQFEAMTSYLSAPEAQSRQSDDYLFPELDLSLEGPGLGITSEKDSEIVNDEQRAGAQNANEEYATEVARYIEGVRRSTEDLKMRMDEVKQLNGIQLDIISDLRKELKDLHSKLEIEIQKETEIEDETSEELEEPEDPERSIIPITKPGISTIWGAVGDALDSFGNAFYDC